MVAITKEKISKPSIKGFKIHNYLWGEFGKKDLNLRDYDGVIIDLSGIDQKASGVNWGAFKKTLDVDVTRDVLLENSSFIILVGDPSTTGGDKPIAELFGIKLRYFEGKGDSINKTEHLEESKYKDYLQGIKTYDYSFDNPEVGPRIEALADRINFKHAVDEVPFIVTRAGKIVAAQLVPVIYDTNYSGYRDRVHVMYHGELILLPCSKLDPSESIRLLLEANKGHEGDNSKPEWLDLIKVAGEEEVRAKISDNQTAINELTGQKDVLLLELADLRKPLDVLYKSDKSLEESIKDILRTAGATIIEPETSDKVEFYITHGSLKFVVEVKSTIGQVIDQKGLRQVLDWQNDAFDLTGENYKALVIASVQYNEPLDVRNTDILPPNLIEYSTKKEIAVLTVIDLYNTCQDIARGDIKIEFFLSQLNELSGLYEYSSPDKEAGVEGVEQQ